MLVILKAEQSAGDWVGHEVTQSDRRKVSMTAGQKVAMMADCVESLKVVRLVEIWPISWVALGIAKGGISHIKNYLRC